MAKFLKGFEINTGVENILREANSYLLIISPYIKLHHRYKDVLKNHIENDSLQIVLVFGKNDGEIQKSLPKEELDFFVKFPNIEIRYEKRLHAKFYANESSSIITSMNLYDYSQDNNIEAGIFLETPLLNLITGTKTLDIQATEYFEEVITNSELLFTQPNVNAEKLKKIVIPNCPIEVQDRYMSFLNREWKDDLLENRIKKTLSLFDDNQLLKTEQTSQLDLLKKLRQQILQDAVQGKLVPQDPNDEPANKLLERIKAEKGKLVNDNKIKKDKPLPEIKPNEIPFEIPNNWVWCRLGDMSINRDGERNPISQVERERREKIYDYYGASGVIDKIDGFTHEGEYLLIGEDGANLKMKSTPIAFIAKGKFWVNNHAHVLDFIDSVTLIYMENCLNGIDINGFITGGFQPKLSQGNLNLIPIPLPPLPEQHRIVANIKQLMNLCDELEQSIQQSQKYTQELLHLALKEALEPGKIKMGPILL